jgi:hypothetical protein
VIRKCWELTVLKRRLQSAIGGWNLFAFAIACRRTTLRPACHLRRASCACRFFCGHHVTPQRLRRWLEQPAGLAYPVGRCRTIQLHSNPLAARVEQLSTRSTLEQAQSYRPVDTGVRARVSLTVAAWPLRPVTFQAAGLDHALAVSAFMTGGYGRREWAGRALGRVPNGVPESPSISAGERRPYVAVSTFIYFATSATLGGYC